MKIEELQPLIEAIVGCTFAGLDTETMPKAGVTLKTTGSNVIIFNSESSGYEKMVRRRLKEAGKDPNTFNVGPLPWGERVYGPLIYHNGRHYLQTILLREGDKRVFFGPNEVPMEVARQVLPRRSINPDLPKNKQVVMNTYALDSIRAIRLLGKQSISLVERERKPLLRLKIPD